MDPDGQSGAGRLSWVEVAELWEATYHTDLMDQSLPKIHLFLKYYRKRKNQELQELLSIFHCAKPQDMYKALDELRPDVEQKPTKKESW